MFIFFFPCIFILFPCMQDHMVFIVVIPLHHEGVPLNFISVKKMEAKRVELLCHETTLIVSDIGGESTIVVVQSFYFF